MATRAERFFCKILYDRSRSRIGPLSRSQSLPVLTALLRPTLTHINKTLSFAHEFLIRLYLYTALPPLTARRRRRLRWINKEFSLGFSHVYALNWMLYGFSLIGVVKKSTSHNKALEDPSVFRWLSPRATVCVCVREGSQQHNGIRCPVFRSRYSGQYLGAGLSELNWTELNWTELFAFVFARSPSSRPLSYPNCQPAKIIKAVKIIITIIVKN